LYRPSGAVCFLRNWQASKLGKLGMLGLGLAKVVLPTPDRIFSCQIEIGWNNKKRRVSSFVVQFE